MNPFATTTFARQRSHPHHSPQALRPSAPSIYHSTLESCICLLETINTKSFERHLSQSLYYTQVENQKYHPNKTHHPSTPAAPLAAPEAWSATLAAAASTASAPPWWPRSLLGRFWVGLWVLGVDTLFLFGEMVGFCVPFIGSYKCVFVNTVLGCVLANSWIVGGLLDKWVLVRYRDVQNKNISPKSGHRIF